MCEAYMCMYIYMYIENAYSTVIDYRPLGSHEHGDWLFEKEAPYVDHSSVYHSWVLRLGW